MNEGDECKKDDDRTFGLPILFGARRRTQLLGILVHNRRESLTPTEIVRETDFSHQALYDHLTPLTELGVLQTNDTRKPSYYQLHPELTTTEKLIELHEYASERGLLASPDTFEPLFSTDSHAKLFSALARSNDETFTQPGATERAGISAVKFYTIVSDLQDVGVVATDGKDGKAVRYKLQNWELWDLLADLEQMICTEIRVTDSSPQRSS